MDKSTSSFGDAAVFSMLDKNSEYPQIAIDKADLNRTVFISRNGLY